MEKFKQLALMSFLLAGFLIGCNNQNSPNSPDSKSKKVISQKENSKRTYLSGESRQEIPKIAVQEIEQEDYFKQIQETSNNDIEKISIKTADEKFEEEFQKWKSWDYNSRFALRIQVLEKQSKMPLENVLIKIKKVNGAWADDIVTDIEHKGKLYSKNFYYDLTDNEGLVLFCLRKKELDSHVFDNSMITLRKENYGFEDILFSLEQFQWNSMNVGSLNKECKFSLKSMSIRFNGEANEKDYREQLLKLETDINNVPYKYVHDQLIRIVDLEILMNPIKEKTYKK